MNANDVMADIVQRVIDEIDAGAQTWHMPWTTQHTLPYNATTGHPYRGINTLALWLETIHHGHSSNAWATYKQWNAAGAQVRKGEHGTRLIRWVEHDTNRPDRKQESTSESRLLPVAFVVFNADQCDTIPNGAIRQVTPRFEGNFAHFFDAIPATIRWGTGNPAYLPALDIIVMPDWDAFHTTAAGHATLAHELAHWTALRLGRDLTGRFGDDSYAVEELIAELSAAFTCAEVGIPPAIRDDHAPYLNHWLRILRAEPRTLWNIASQAQTATDHLATYSQPAARTVR